MSALKPFSAKGYCRNEEKCRDGEAPCALCGRPCREMLSAVQVVDGGARFATEAEVRGDVAVEESGDMGAFPVGEACARKLRRFGVYVFAWVAS